VKLLIGKRIKQLRKEKNLSQEQLANIIGISRTTLIEYEKETGRKPTAEVLDRIAKYFHVSVDYLLGNTDIRNIYAEKMYSNIQELKEDLGKALNKITALSSQIENQEKKQNLQLSVKEKLKKIKDSQQKNASQKKYEQYIDKKSER